MAERYDEKIDTFYLPHEIEAAIQYSELSPRNKKLFNNLWQCYQNLYVLHEDYDTIYQDGFDQGVREGKSLKTDEVEEAEHEGYRKGYSDCLAEIPAKY